MSAYYNANSSGYTSELRQQNVVDAVQKLKNGCAEKRVTEVEVPARESGFHNEALSPDIVNQFCGVKFSEQRYASAKCRIDIAKSYLCDAKRHFKKGDHIAMLSYMNCSLNHTARAMLDLKEECDENHIDIMAVFERIYIHTNLFDKNNFLFWQKISYVFNKIVRGDFFSWPRESFSEYLRRTSIFIGAAEEVFLCYYKYTNKEIENSKGGNDHE